MRNALEARLLGAVVLLGCVVPTAWASEQSEGSGLLELLGAGFLGALLVKLLDIGYQEVRRRFERGSAARQYVDEHLDPVLKAGDEVVGKLRSLAMEDFRTLKSRRRGAGRSQDLVDVVYLLASFWASLEVFRGGGQTVSVVRDKRGKKLSDFVNCLESRRVRIVNRSSQRAVAEMALARGSRRWEGIQFIEFVRRLEQDQAARRWVAPVVRMLSRMQHTANVQRLLCYGVLVQAMVDSLDPGHAVSRERPSYPDKLSRRSKAGLRRRFRVYLPFVQETQKYLGPP